MDSESRKESIAEILKGMSTETKTGILLTLIFFFSIFLSTFFVIGPAVRADYAVSGGSDAYYNMRIVQYILSTHRQLLFDPGLNYPVGLENPRPPFFMWLAVMLGYAFSPILGGVYSSTMTMFLESTAIGGALIIFPTYFLGKEIFDRKVGLIAALLVAMSPLTLMKSIASIGLFDIFTALFGVMFIYYFLRSVNTFRYDGQVSSLSDVLISIKKNPISVIYSLLAAVSLAASMLTWVGSISLVLILVGAAVIQLIIFSLKRKSALPIFVANLFFGFGFLIAFPWYYVAHFIPVRFDYPLILWFALFIVSVYFLLLEKRPWLISVGAFILVGIAGIVVLDHVDRNLIYSILSGQHYFIKNKIYDTIAEAQALPLGEDMMEYGAVPFFASFIGLAYLIYRWIRTATFNMTLAVLYFGGIIIISMIASKFLYFGAVAASVITGYILVKSFELLKFKEAVEKTRGRTLRTALRKEIKFSHYVAILIVIFLLVVPTTFYAVDSAIPYNNKTIYDRELYNATPSFLRPANYTNNSLYYLGAFGPELATPNQALNTFESWFQNQDTQLPFNQRPAFMSWWDYGFQTIEQGAHPVMADNFQDGIYPAAQILLAQNESQILGVMIARMLYNFSLTNSFNSSGINLILEQYLGANGTNTVINYEIHPSRYISQIYSDPSFFGNYEKVQGGDALYILVEHYLANKYPLGTLINLYQAIENKMNQYMAYIGIDSGLFPFNGTNTGIFYAPSYLGDFPWVNASGEIIPVAFYNITATDTSGNTYPLQDFPPGDTAVSYNINYTPEFYNTTIYRGLIGYPPSVVGAKTGIPGISSNLSSYPTMPGWGMPNFELVYDEVLWNPYTDYQNHTNAWKLVSLEQGYYYLKNHDGTVDLYPPPQVLENEVVALEYFPGAIIHGRVTNTLGQPIGGVRVTLDDQYGIPHMTTITNSSGFYSIYAVAGNDTVVFSTGTYNALSMAGNKTLSTFNITISQAQANRDSYNIYGQPTWNITHNLVLPVDRVNGVMFLNLVKSNVYIPNTDVPISGTIVYYNSTYNTMYTTNTTQNGSYGIYDLKPYMYNVSAYVMDQWYYNVTTATISSNATSLDIPIPFGIVNATLSEGTTLYPGSVITFSRGNQHLTYNLTKPNQRINLPVGIFNVSAENDGLWDNFTVQLTYNTTTKLGLSFSKYYTARFSTFVGSTPVNASLQLYSSTGKYLSVFTTNGTANVSVSATTYSVYALTYYQGKYYALTDILNISGNENFTFYLRPSYLITGKFSVNGIPQNGSEITITGNNTLIDLHTGPSGYFLIHLPQGQYTAVAESTVNSSIYVSMLQFTETGASLNISLNGVPGSEISGSASFEGNGVNGLLTTFVDGRPYYFTMVNDGSYSIYVPKGLVPTMGPFISPGYSVLTENETSVILRQLNVTVNIAANYPGSYPLTLNLTGETSYSVIGTHQFRLTLKPGNYTVSFYRPGTIITTKSILDVLPGIENQTFTLNVSLLANLNVDAQNVFVFNNSKLVSTSNESTLYLGNYTIYSYSGSLAFIGSLDLTKNMTFVPAFTDGFNVSLPSNVTITGNFGSIFWSGSIILPKGNYTFTVENRVNQTYEFYATTSAFISSPTHIALNVSMRMLSSKLYINSGNSGYGTFTVMGPINETSILGTTVTLPYGNYSIYVRSGDRAYFGNFVVSSPSTYLNITLEKAYPLNYGTYINNTSYLGKIRLGTSYYINPSGIIYLPNGTYRFFASAKYEYYGFVDNFTMNQTVNVSGVSSATLVLKVVRIINVSFFPEAGSPVLKANQSYTFPMIITSRSNVPLNFSVEGTSTFKVTGGILDLLPYSTGMINVTITVPKGEPSGVNSVTMRAYYGTTYKEITVNVTVPKLYNVTAKVVNSTGKIVHNIIEIPLVIKNSGNTNTVVNGTIVNYLQLSSQGINVTFNGSKTYSGLIYAFTSNTTYLTINSTGSKIYGKQILISLSYQNNTFIIETSIHPPALSVIKAKGEGKDLSLYSQSEQQYYIYGLTAFVIIAMVIAMVAFRRRQKT
ncbi:MAG: STT3 domain-containing protein [Thermoplasmatales archaeon]